MLVLLPLCLAASALVSCSGITPAGPGPAPLEDTAFTRAEIARIFSELPLGEEQYNEVFDAVSSSSGNGYDEEYMMTDLFSCPGAGVGERHSSTRASSYSTPIRDLFSDYLRDRYSTKAGAADVEAYLNALSESALQIYWPYSEDWDGSEPPVITFDPGYGAESNYGYEIVTGPDGARVVDSLLVTEEVARSRAVWVINSNDDSAFTPLDFYTKASSGGSSGTSGGRQLLMKSFKALRHYDSWFGGASEFFVKLGAVDGFKAKEDDELKLYYPTVTDFIVVVKRKDMGKELPYNSIMLTDLTSQMEKLAFLIIEDDGGTTTSWKCSATVKYQSKSYGFDIDIPYRDKDDIVWRGQLDASFFEEGKDVSGRFGDVVVTFATR